MSWEILLECKIHLSSLLKTIVPTGGGGWWRQLQNFDVKEIVSGWRFISSKMCQEHDEPQVIRFSEIVIGNLRARGGAFFFVYFLLQ